MKLELRKALKYRNRTLKWLATKKNVNYSNLCEKINKDNISMDELKSLLKTLDLNVMIVIYDPNTMKPI